MKTLSISAVLLMIRSAFKKLSFEYRRFRRAAEAAQRQWNIRFLNAATSIVFARIKFRHGPQSHSLYRLAGRPFSEWSSYLWEPDVLENLKRINPPPQKYLVRDKIEFYVHCSQQGISTVPVLFISRPSQDSMRGWTGNTTKEYEKFITGIGSTQKRVFFKPISGAHGAGAFSATRASRGWSYLGRDTDTAELYEYCKQHFQNAAWFCQPVVEAHEDLQPIMSPGALGTVRIVTYLSDSTPRVAIAVIRLPSGANVTDNFSQGTGGNIVAPVEVESGQIGNAWHSVAEDWPEIEEIVFHPDTNKRICGLFIPYWGEVRELVLFGQSVTPQLPTMGWDVAVTNSGPVVIEANTEYAIDILQIAHNRGLRDELSFISKLR